MKQKVLFTLAFLFGILVPQGAKAYDFSAVAPTGQRLYYNISGSTVEVTTQNSNTPYYSTYPTGNIEIPSSITYNGTSYSVTSIGNYAFYDCINLTNVTIPNSVTSIGDYAFMHCSGLTRVTIPNSVTSIGDYAFNCCSDLTSIIIPNSVTSIGVQAFSGCSGLTNISVANGNTVYDSRNGCNAIIETATSTLIAGCKNTTIPNSVTSIGFVAFSGCTGLTSVTIPNSVTSIGGGAFSGCTGLTSVTIPNSVTSIGDYAFCNCMGLDTIYFLSITPTTLGNNALNYYSTGNYYPLSCVMSIPCGTLSAYQSAWGSNYNYYESCNTQFTVTASSNNAAWGTVTGGGTYNQGATATLTATANAGYYFVQWNDGVTDNPRTVTVTDNVTYTAYFVVTQGIEDSEADDVVLTAHAGRITISGAEGHRVTLVDALGRTLYRGTATETLTIDVPAAGVYLLQVEDRTSKRIAVVQ